MSSGKRHYVYGVWIGTNKLGFEKGKAYKFHITTYLNESHISIIGNNDKFHEYETLIQFLWDWKYVMRLEK